MGGARRKDVGAPRRPVVGRALAAHGGCLGQRRWRARSVRHARRRHRTGGDLLMRAPSLLLLVLACDVSPLTREQLFGPPDAAAAGPRDAATDTPPEECVPRSRDGLFSGAVLDACTGAAVNASVGLAGQHLCTFAQKGSFQFQGLPVGCRLTLSATADGYQGHYTTVVIDPGGSPGYLIRLDRPCQAPMPTPSCRCDMPGCVTP